MADTLLDIPPVLIVGAGPTGLAAAMSLARARVPVRIGAASVDRVEILRGLKAGDRVILSDTSQWDKYDRIKLR